MTFPHPFAASRKFIVICSPNGRDTDYINDEIRRFAQSHETDDIIHVLIAGIHNKSQADNAELAFPDALVNGSKYRSLATIAASMPKRIRQTEEN